MKFHSDFNLHGTIAGIYTTPDKSEFLTQEVEHITATLEGFEGDRHGGLVRNSGPRDKHYDRETEVRNNRQWSAVSVDEQQITAETMGLSQLSPEWIGANFLINGIRNLTHLPPLSHLFIESSDPCVLVIWQKNMPCTKPEKYIRELSKADIRVPYPKAAIATRGILGWVDKPGLIEKGNSFSVRVPDYVQIPDLTY